MLEHYYSRPSDIKRIRNSPLGPFIDEIVEQLYSENCSWQYVHDIVPSAAAFGCWLKDHKISFKKLSDDHLQAFFHDQDLLDTRTRKNKKIGARRIYQLLRKAYPPRQTPAEAEAALFSYHLEKDCGLSPTYIKDTTSVLLEFLRHFFPKGKVVLSSLTPAMIEEYIKNVSHKSSDFARLKCASTLRCYVRFLKTSERSPGRIELGIPPIRRPPRTLSPNVLTSVEMDDLLNSIDHATVQGKTAYAIIACLSDLALRNSDLLRLSLDDIDWRSSKIKIPTPKNAVPYYLPLTKRVGDALADYIRHARPKSELRQVFLRKPHGIVKTASKTSVRFILRKQWDKSGLAKRFCGTHILRHTTATNLVQKGFGVKTIADVLGHTYLGSTCIYAQVDIPSLRLVARPWPNPK